MNNIRIPKKLILLPQLIFTCVWILISILYSLKISYRLYFDWFIIFQYVSLILLFFISSSFVVDFFLKITFVNKSEFNFTIKFLSKKKLLRFLFLFISLILLEFVYEGYVPLISKSKGIQVSHFEFGIPTLHGLLFAGMIAFSTISFFFYILRNERYYLYPIILLLIFSTLVLSRKVFMVSAVQYLLVFLSLKKVNVVACLKTAFFLLALIIAFGFLGDLRSGSEAIENLGQFNPNNPLTNIPGFKWVYLYLTTPLHNLIYAFDKIQIDDYTFFSKTVNSLIPSAISNILFGYSSAQDRFLEAAANRFWLESEAFNVSTAFINPYLDMNFLGIFIYCFILCSISLYFYRAGASALSFFFLVMFDSSIVLSIYSDNLTNLNFIGQVIWFYLIISPPKLKITKTKVLS